MGDARTYLLAEDMVGMTHVLNRTRSLCGVAVGPAEAEVTVSKPILARLLIQLNRGCMNCMTTVTGARPEKKGAYLP